MMRTITIQLDPDKLPQDAQDQIDKAILRLMHWAEERYPLVGIYHDGPDDMIANYRNEDGTTGYVIGAVWRAESKEYSFHS